MGEDRRCIKCGCRLGMYYFDDICTSCKRELMGTNDPFGIILRQKTGAGR